jgi:hypothetical protein
MRSLRLLILLAGCLGTGGCLQSVLAVILAPESVVGSAANSAARTGAEALSESGLDDATAAVQDIDRLLKEYPNADNATRLKALKDQLERDASAQAGGVDGAGKRQIARQQGDMLLIDPPGDAVIPRRSVRPRPAVLPTGRGLIPEAEPDHLLLMDPIRVN